MADQPHQVLGMHRSSGGAEARPSLRVASMPEPVMDDQLFSSATDDW